MNVAGEVVVKAPKENVWKALNDPETLKKATPGCKSLTEVEPDRYKAEISVGIAAVRGDYESTIAILDKVEPDRYRLIMNANSPVGFVEGDAIVELMYEDAKTYIKYDGTAQVGGKVAGVGQRMLSGVAKMIVKDFFKKIAKETKTQVQ
ncbi:SRPBCC family protein [Aneurinibacillus sp. REN35]|uniref:SRPBCC family protein n=1 Tax=Aneurinibacillus sp. REN35 TaxID=3237286 RepID=UPI003529544D